MDHAITTTSPETEEIFLPSVGNGDIVAEYTRFFQNLARPTVLFDSFRAQVTARTPQRAKVVGSLWYHLSEAIVDILCISLSKLENPRIRHHVIQTAYEELGEDSEAKIHTLLLRECLHIAGVTDADILAWSGHEAVNQCIESLRENLLACVSDEEICGILLGMEIIAFENIGNVVDFLSYSDEVSERVNATEWVRLHNTLEEAHIHRSVSVFVQHVGDFTARRKFVQKYMQTIRFWARFWNAIASAATATA